MSQAVRLRLVHGEGVSGLFRVTEVDRVVRGGVAFHRHPVARDLDAA